MLEIPLDAENKPIRGGLAESVHVYEGKVGPHNVKIIETRYDRSLTYEIRPDGLRMQVFVDGKEEISVRWALDS